MIVELVGQLVDNHQVVFVGCQAASFGIVGEHKVSDAILVVAQHEHVVALVGHTEVLTCCEGGGCTVDGTLHPSLRQ